MYEPSFGEYVQIGVGGQAIGAQAHSSVLNQKFPERMWRMLEGSVSAGAVDDGHASVEVACGISRFQIISVDEE